MKRRVKKVFKAGVYVGCGFVLYAIGVGEGVKLQKRRVDEELRKMEEELGQRIWSQENPS